MRIAKPLLLTTTPIGMGIGLYEGYRLTGGMVLLMFAFMALIGIAIASVVRTIRREEREAQTQAQAPLLQCVADQQQQTSLPPGVQTREDR